MTASLPAGRGPGTASKDAEARKSSSSRSATARTPRSRTSAASSPCLIRRVEIRILPHFELHFLALLFVVQQQHAVAQVAALHLLLSPLEQAQVLLRVCTGLQAEPFELLSRVGAKTGPDHVVVERHVLPHGARISLAAATA